MLASLMSLPVSIALLIWILRMKKEKPFPRTVFVKLLIAGLVVGIVASFFTIVGAVVNFISIYGFDTLRDLFDFEKTQSVMEQLRQSQQDPGSIGIVRGFIKTFIIVGFVEEIFKFLGARIFMKKEEHLTWMDALLYFCVVAISFQLSEDFGYASGNMTTAIFRALTPFHFTFAAILGYYYGLGKVKGSKFYVFLAIFIPSFLHTLFDYSASLTASHEMAIIPYFLSAILLFVLTIVMIVKINKWHKNKTLDIEI